MSNTRKPAWLRELNPGALAPVADRIAIALGLFGLVASSWAYLIWQDRAMNHMDLVAMAMPSLGAWGFDDLLLVFVMWAIMMVAMMLPSALPMILLFARVSKSHAVDHSHLWHTSLFVSGYLLVWTGFSVLATGAQWAMHAASAISPMMVGTSSLLSAAILIAAGVYQWTPLKQACLTHCQSPLGYLVTQWRAGAFGAFRMGFRHGIYCTGCCWLLMALLFVVGVMSLLWIALLSGFVLAEKLFRGGAWASRASGVLLVAWGVWLLANGTAL